MSTVDHSNGNERTTLRNNILDFKDRWPGVTVRLCGPGLSLRGLRNEEGTNVKLRYLLFFARISVGQKPKCLQKYVYDRFVGLLSYV